MTDLSSYAAGWRQRALLEQLSLEARRQQALADAHRIAKFLGEKIGVAKVVGLGSLFIPDRFGRRSDIDLVVLGLPNRDYFSASAQIRFMTDFAVDLIPYESANALMQQRVAEEGVQLWP